MAPYRWSIAIGELPPGLSLTQDGIISGTPDAAGTRVFQVKLIDFNSRETVKDLAVTVDGPSDGAGPTEEGAGGGGCFIATAAYGSYLDPHVQVLREFRDHYLLTNEIGRPLVAAYYRVSPPIADIIGEYQFLRVTTRWALTPIVFAIEAPVFSLVVIFIGILVYGIGKNVVLPTSRADVSRKRSRVKN